MVIRYYTAPSGKVLRSICDIEKYLIAHPEYVEQGVTLAQFSFQIPKPLQENLRSRKRSSSVAALPDGNDMRMPESFQPSPAATLSLPGPEPSTDLQLVMNLSSKKARCELSTSTYDFDLMYMHNHDM
ncbi:methyl-CpG-binding domain-containing protein 2-like [Bidens hawaiensis]|uniref:methyl-CpG-binding domain-containing protein 2-like n=1 Tax=Bidens hawaiensis TaxID=980011 RepID=UPI00404B13F9